MRHIGFNQGAKVNFEESTSNSLILKGSNMRKAFLLLLLSIGVIMAESSNDIYLARDYWGDTTVYVWDGPLPDTMHVGVFNWVETQIAYGGYMHFEVIMVASALEGKAWGITGTETDTVVIITPWDIMIAFDLMQLVVDTISDNEHYLVWKDSTNCKNLTFKKKEGLSLSFKVYGERLLKWTYPNWISKRTRKCYASEEAREKYKKAIHKYFYGW